MRQRLKRHGFLLVLLALWAFPSSCAFIHGYAAGRSTDMLAFERQGGGARDVGMARFVFDDLGGLNTDTLRTIAVPWKVTAAALVLDHAETHGTPIDTQTLDQALRSFGFIQPSLIANWSSDLPQPKFTKPLGIVAGRVTRSFPTIELEVANLGCAACHAGVLYDRNGVPESRVWLGLPNTSLNLEAYSWAVYRGLTRAIRSRAQLLGTIDHLFPEVTPLERQTIEHYVLPRIAARFSEVQRTIDAPTPFPNGGPGHTNGIASLKLHLGVLPTDRFNPEFGYVSIPDLGSVALRTSLLADGVYAPPGNARFRQLAAPDLTDRHATRLARIVSFFTVPAMGVKPETARGTIDRIEEIFRFVESYRPPPFPGPVDPALATDGREIYHAKCARCHGRYSEGITEVTLVEFPNRLSPQEEMNTDPERWKAITPELVLAIKTSPYKHDVIPEAAPGYVAPRLTGLWATAPYLHNGSVPTLWHLMHPEERPKRFYVGGHRLDFAKVGIDGAVDATGTLRYPETHRPWATPAVYDTAKPGLSNRGHEREFGSLSEADKQSLLEYLKLL